MIARALTTVAHLAVEAAKALLGLDRPMPVPLMSEVICYGCEHCGCDPTDREGACYACDECEPPDCKHAHFIEDVDGDRLCVRCNHEWWEDPL